jgi:hypothetical protein
MLSVSKLTLADCTPATFFTLRSTAAEQAAQVIPVTLNFCFKIAPSLSEELLGSVYIALSSCLFHKLTDKLSNTQKI